MAVRMSVVLVAAASASLYAASAGAQIPQTFENLQVLPKHISRDTLTQIMRGFTQSLGVRCEFCHVPREGAAAQPGGPGLNLLFASDERENKRKAREMIRMTDSINTRLLASLPARDNPPTDVSCITCHRGLNKPTMIENVLLATTASSGVDSAIARYRVLRNDMALGRFNFGEGPVTEAARQLSGQGKHADGIKLLEMLQEFYPNSANVDIEIASLQLAAGDRDGAIARYRAVLQKNPNDRRAQQALQRLGVQP